MESRGEGEVAQDLNIVVGEVDGIVRLFPQSQLILLQSHKLSLSLSLSF